LSQLGSKKFVLAVFFRSDYFLVLWFLSKKNNQANLKKKTETVSNRLVLVGFWFGYFILKTKNYIVF
jgi:hypothetical protein